MANEPAITIASLALDSVTWTALTVPVPCKAILIRNPLSVDVYYRSDSADSNTQDTLSAGESFPLVSPIDQGVGGHAFGKSATPIYLKTASGTGSIKIHFYPSRHP